jgi:hypothetical protein
MAIPDQFVLSYVEDHVVGEEVKDFPMLVKNSLFISGKLCSI